MDDIKTRMEKLAKAVGMGLTVLGPQIGVGITTLAAVKKSKNGIPSEYIRLIKEKFPEISIEYLVTGEGDVLVSKKADEGGRENDKRIKEVMIAELDRIQGAMLSLRREVEDSL